MKQSGGKRGTNSCSKKTFNLLVDCYSLAICYAPTSDRELLAQLLCNRSLAHIKNNAFTLALLDAERCVKIQPKWSKAHYRLGSSLTGMQRHDDAMVSFASALELADSDEEKYDTLLQILAIGSELEERVWELE
ncbi:small glutamine-rich tetratricopeptide repeat-containing protein beta-like [Acropora muricata]|uniref:small glutamine-rich tetratricopeptide repeat-containing protein beta-like n=1 Tax=Acropora muricata TaxID=159855 RepID=UPI0034E3EB3F